MKRIYALLIALLLCAVPALADSAELTGNALLVHDTVKWCMDVPKNAQVLSATEFTCKMTDDYVGHYMLIHVTQDPTIENMMGFASKIIIVDLNTAITYTYNSIENFDVFEINSPEDAAVMLFNSYDAYIQGFNDCIWWGDGEILVHLPEEDVEAINAALTAHFVK